MLGLRHVTGTGDVMAADAAPSTALTFKNSALRSCEQFNGQIGFQNAPRYLEEVLGITP